MPSCLLTSGYSKYQMFITFTQEGYH